MKFTKAELEELLEKEKNQYDADFMYSISPTFVTQLIKSVIGLSEAIDSMMDNIAVPKPDYQKPFPFAYYEEGKKALEKWGVGEKDSMCNR